MSTGQNIRKILILIKITIHMQIVATIIIKITRVKITIVVKKIKVTRRKVRLCNSKQVHQKVLNKTNKLKHKV